MEARLWAIASPIPVRVNRYSYGKLLVGVYLPRDPPVTMPDFPSKERDILFNVLMQLRGKRGREAKRGRTVDILYPG